MPCLSNPSDVMNLLKVVFVHGFEVGFLFAVDRRCTPTPSTLGWFGCVCVCVCVCVVCFFVFWGVWGEVLFLCFVIGDLRGVVLFVLEVLNFEFFIFSFLWVLNFSVGGRFEVQKKFFFFLLFGLFPEFSDFKLGGLGLWGF